MKLGVFGGTFDPIHVGHLIIAQEAAVEAGLDRVLFVPAGQPWLKAGTSVSEARHRLEMTRLAVGFNDRFDVSSVEVDRSGPTYTADTLEELQQGMRTSDSLHFILGMDALENLHRWSRPERIFALCMVVAVSRPGHRDFDLRALESIVSGASSRVSVVDGPGIGISAAEIRRRVVQGLPITHWVPRPVEEYIYENGLYQEV
ncbi:MAG: nicotinate-nucleotide adenylyltransferase [Chloroflexota bacterium]|nr:nicotinate-nucleotide adenylyltransferase [Chloroflexota bacterium]MDE2942192.1 nicotinate-nucleotide adenylyltransferase [Chloroflexota bacterium]MDE3267507.1 nicotinate-nucleotide adenylyltransferase [Chloroflexota bacterium]